MSCVTQTTGVRLRVYPAGRAYGESLRSEGLAPGHPLCGGGGFAAGGGHLAESVAGLVECVRPGAKLVILNRDPTPYDSRADLVLRGDLVEELAHCVE